MPMPISQFLGNKWANAIAPVLVMAMTVLSYLNKVYFLKDDVINHLLSTLCKLLHNSHPVSRSLIMCYLVAVQIT